MNGILTSHRVAMVVIGLFIMGYTFESVRQSRLLARYAILWMITGGVSFLCGLFPVIPISIVRVFHISSFIAAAGLVIFFFFVMVLFHLSTVLSRIRSDENATARRCAILEAELREMQEKLASASFDKTAESSQPPSSKKMELK